MSFLGPVDMPQYWSSSDLVSIIEMIVIPITSSNLASKMLFRILLTSLKDSVMISVKIWESSLPLLACQPSDL